MCGIAGFVGEGDEAVLNRMIHSIRYRGPDDRGVWHQRQIGLAHARLSIIDLSPAGHQPMFSPDRSVGLVFNGEIYNFRELRSELEALDKYRFAGSSDTEVIIYLYQEYGERAFEKLNGMFAIALYDFRADKIFLVRDRLGKKPLYWGVFKKTLVFASELKALLEHPAVTKAVDFEALHAYIHYEYVPTPKSIFSGIHKLEPATYLEWKNGVIAKKEFWRPDFSPLDLSFADAADRLEQLIDQSVKRRLVSDVPLGIFLSGGIDSSTIAYFAQKNSPRRIKTFSIGFAEKTFDESSYAQHVAHLLQTDHAHHMVTPQAAMDSIPAIFDKLDEPLADASIIPTYILSRFTRKSVTVALGGDGGDELFAGYQVFQASQLADWYMKIPTMVRQKILEPLIRSLPVKDSYFSREFKLKRFIGGLHGSKTHFHQQWMESFQRAECQPLFQPELWRAHAIKHAYPEISYYLSHQQQAAFSNQMIYLFLRMYLLDDILPKVDRASMYNALEVRAPFLDYTLVDFVCRLPYNYKYRLFQTKRILKRVMLKYLPREIIFRRKKGFGLPLTHWLGHELKPLCNELLSETNLRRGNIFNPQAVESLKQDHFAGRRDNRKELWTLMVWQLFYDRWVK